MLQRIARALLAVALASSGATAPFMHVHAHGSAHGASAHGDGIDEHCEHHHAEGAHWHPAGKAPADDGGAPAAAEAGHRHAAVALSAAAIESLSTGVGPFPAAVEAPEAGAPPIERGVRAPVDSTAGPDPPPRTVAAARAPPVRS